MSIMKPDYNQTFNLADIIKELRTEPVKIYAEPEAIKERFKKLMNALNQEKNYFKSVKREYVFYYDQKELIKALLIEMEEPYLQRLTSNKHVGKTIAESIPAANAFKERMLKHMEQANLSPEGKKLWVDSVNVLSRYELYLVSARVTDKMKLTLEDIYSSALTYGELIEITMELEEILDNWRKKRLG